MSITSNAKRTTFLAILVLLALFSNVARGDDKPLSMRDIARMRHERVTPEQIVEKASGQGVGFAVTPGVEKQLSRLGFTPEQIDAIKEAASPKPKAERNAGRNAPPIVPGQGLPSGDAQRNKWLELVAKITKLSGANVQPFESRHITLWTAKDIQAGFMPDLKKIEKFLEGKCQEPLRSGLDKRAAHLVLLKTRYDYEKWVNAMFEVMPETARMPDAPDAQGANAALKATILKCSGYYSHHFVVLCLEGLDDSEAHRKAATGVGYMNFVQQIDPQRQDPLATGFANGCESLVCGSPSVMIFSNSYGNENRDLGNAASAWLRLVQERMRAKKENALSDLLQKDTTNMRLPEYAEAWTLVGLLAKQPEKFAKLVLELRTEKDALKAIELIYGWDEKKLTEEWRKDVLAQM
jgi:hypothetical protein